MGCLVPQDMDGRVLCEIFASGSEPGRREVSYTETEPGTWRETDMTEEEASLIAERPRDLGTSRGE